MGTCQNLEQIYHVNKAPINLSNPILKTSYNSQLFLCIEDKLRPNLDFNQLPNLVKVKKAAQGSTYNST